MAGPLSITVTPQSAVEEPPVENEEVYTEPDEVFTTQPAQPGPTGLMPERLEAFKGGFDIEQASRAGLTDQDIIGYIRDVFPEFDYDAATSIQTVTDENGNEVKVPGYTDREIVSFFTKASEAGPLEAIGTELTRGAIQSGPAMYLGGLGLETGMAMGNPLAALTLGAIGFGAGYLAGDKIQSYFLPQEPYAPSVRPYAEGALTVGSGSTAIIAPYMWTGKLIPEGTKAYVNNVARLNGRNIFTTDPSKLTPMESIGRRAVEKPVRYLTGEAAPLLSSGYAASISEQKYPGDMLARMAYETGAGLLSPVSIVGNLAENIWNRGAAFFSEEAQQTRQGVALIDWLKKNAPIQPGLGKEESDAARVAYVQGIFEKLQKPDEVQEIAAEMGIKMPKRTTASLLEDPVILGLQSNLGQDRVDGARMRAAINRDYLGMANLIDLMKNSGDPALIAESAKLQAEFFQGIVARKLDDANLAALNLIKKIDPNDPRAGMRASKVIENLTNKTMLQLRAFEKKLYNNIDKNQVLPEGPQSFLDEFTRIEQDLLDNEITIPGAVRRLAFKARGESADQADINAEAINRLQKNIANSGDTIRRIQARNPGAYAAIEGSFSGVDSPELQLSNIQDMRVALTADKALSKFKIKADERADRVRLLDKKAEIISDTLQIKDLSNQKPFAEVPEQINIGELMAARSVLLNRARQASSNKDFMSAHFYSDLADAIKDDLSVASGGPDADPKTLTENQVAIQTATEFTKAFHDAFSRSFPSTVLAKSKSGARKVMPELLYKSLFSGGGDATALKYDGLEQAMRFADDRLGVSDKQVARNIRLLDDIPISQAEGVLEGLDQPFSRVGSMRIAQNMLLRNLVSDPKIVGTDGKINAENLRRHLYDYRNVYFDENNVSRFPGLTEDLQDLQKAQSLVDTVLAQKGAYEDAVKNSFVLSQLELAGTNPEKLIRNIIGAPGSRTADDPAGAFKDLIRYAKAADQRFAAEGKPTGALKGIVDIVLERGRQYASGTNRKTGEVEFNMKGFADYLRQPLNGLKGDSALLVMQREGALTSDEAVRLNKILNYGIASQGQRGLADPSGTVPGTIITNGMDTMLRLIGLRVGRKATQMAPGTGQGLAEPAMIANEFSALLNVPKMKHADLMMRAMEDPDFFRLLMEKGGEGGPKSVGIRRSLNAYLYNAGLISATDYEREKQRREFDPRETRQRVKPVVRPPVELPSQVPSGPPLSQTVPMPPSRPSSPTPQPVAQAQPSGPVDRARFAAVFPEDRELLGIGSLMG
jgi:hypothetical protein